MPSVTIDELQKISHLRAWLEAGVTVELREDGRVIGRIIPEESEIKHRPEWPDFAARANQILGDRILPGSEYVMEEREESPY